MRRRRGAVCWTRELELRLVNLVREQEVIWKPRDNTNHNIQLKYRAYADMAQSIGGDSTARSVRDRWVNIRSTFNHNLRKLNQSLKTATCPEDVYVPSWPLWKTCQFLRFRRKNGPENSNGQNVQAYQPELLYQQDTTDDAGLGDLNIPIRQRLRRTDRPRIKPKALPQRTKTKKRNCKRVLDDLVTAMKPLSATLEEASKTNAQEFWFFGRHVTERLSKMRTSDAQCASQMIVELLKNWPERSNGC